MDQHIPTGKRTVRGTIKGYIERTPWMVFGERADVSAQERASAWLTGEVA